MHPGRSDNQARRRLASGIVTCAVTSVIKKAQGKRSYVIVSNILMS